MKTGCHGNHIFPKTFINCENLVSTWKSPEINPRVSNNQKCTSEPGGKKRKKIVGDRSNNQ